MKVFKKKSIQASQIAIKSDDGAAEVELPSKITEISAWG